MNNITRRTVLTALCAFAFFSSLAQRDDGETFVFAEYNVENLFDTVHCEGKQDADFTPQGAYHWTHQRYRSKLRAIARVIASFSDDKPAALVALCEVENDSVVRDLAERTRLARMGYSYIVTNSPDVRGIDVALLYQPLRFQPVSIDTLRVNLGVGKRPTRDILHVAGRLQSGDTLDVVVCHLPSRYGGRLATENDRATAASMIRSLADSLRNSRERFGLIVAGDFNDELQDKSLSKILEALPAADVEQQPFEKQQPSSKSPLPESGQILPNRLYDVCCRAETHAAANETNAALGGMLADIDGTYKFQGFWQHIDHVLLSGTILSGHHSLVAEPRCARIMALDFMIEADGEHEIKPRRTFLGSSYHGGVSDHLPTVVKMKLRRR